MDTGEKKHEEEGLERMEEDWNGTSPSQGVPQIADTHSELGTRPGAHLPVSQDQPASS